MNQNYQTPSNNMLYNYTRANGNNDRLAGGFVFPFLLGGVTGAALAPSFWGNNYNNRPMYYYTPMPYYPYPYPYQRRWF